MNNVTIIIRQPLERLPPIINLIDCLIELEFSINLICDKSSNHLIEKYSNSVQFFIVKPQKLNIPILGKAINWLSFRKKVLHLLKKERSLYNRDTILWIGSADAGMPLMIGGSLKKFNYVFQCHELYDAFPNYIRRIKSIMENAILNVGPEKNRNAIYRSFYQLKETPVFLPNKPLFHPNVRNIGIEDEFAKNIINQLQSKKILLYQGGIVKERDVSPIARAIDGMEDWVLVLMGNTDKSDYLENLLKSFPKTIHIPPIKAPKHLEITSWCRIGLVSYSFDDLNHVFCAPNKTWEFTGFGIPLLGNVVPGLMNDIERYKSGIVVNLENGGVEDIQNAIREIDLNYEEFSMNAKKYYESVDVRYLISEIFKKIKSINR